MRHNKLKYTDIVATPLNNHRWRILKNINYRKITIPSNFVTNGADVPKSLWCIQPPNDSNIFPAVVIHDYLCNLKKYKAAEVYFKEALKDLGVKPSLIKQLTTATGLYAKYIRPLELKFANLFTKGK